MEKIAVLILAAGLGKRMGSKAPKVLTQTRGGSVLELLLGGVAPLNPERCVIVTGFGRELVEKDARALVESNATLKKALSFAVQEKQLGTGDAVRSALDALEKFTGTVLILPGDTPLVRSDSLTRLLKFHTESKATISLLSFRFDGPNSYGRVVRGQSNNEVAHVVEARDCPAELLNINEYNSGVYAVESSFLAPAINQLKAKNAQGEYYLTDIIEIAAREGQRVCALLHNDSNELLGFNSFAELATVDRAFLRRDIDALLEKGVILRDPATFYCDPGVQIEAGVIIGPNVQILGKSIIKSGTVFEGSAWLKDTQIESNCTVKFGIRAEGAIVGSGSMVGPFAHLRPGTVLAEDVKVGNFVETKNTRMAKGAKASHLTYLGDATVGKDANIGAGTITCNYDGVNKNTTTIGENVFIGSNSALVAPVTIEDGAYVGAGSVITKSVPKDSLAFTRAPMITKDGWAKRKHKKGH